LAVWKLDGAVSGGCFLTDPSKGSYVFNDVSGLS